MSVHRISVSVSLRRFWLPLFRVVLLLCIVNAHALAQTQDTTKNTETANITDVAVNSDTARLKKGNDSTAASKKLEDSLGIRISKDALGSKVTATASDSAVMSIRTNNFRLYGNANVDFENMKLGADEIEFDQGNSIATARMVTDSAAKRPKLPTFSQGTEKFTYDWLQYNFKSKRAVVRNARSQYGEGFVHSEQIKRNADQSLYGWKSVYTTCALDHPHFGIRANKIKIIPEKAIATGSANLMLEGVPTPLFLPFGLFPIAQSHRSGFILPGYTIEQRRGLGFTRGGYYFYLNDYADLQLQADVFTKGSWAGYMTSRYYNKYHYSGSITGSYSLSKTGEDYDPAAITQRDFMLHWQHQKDPKSLPGINFNADVNIQSGSYFQNNSYNTNQILQNQYSSNISFSKNWQGTPFSVTASATHNQNITTRQVTATLPDVTFYMASQNPFRRKVAVGSTKWYEKINLSYTAHALNRIVFYDSALNLGKLGANDFSNGLQHSIPIAAAYTMLRYINVSFNANYNEYWYTRKMSRAYNDLDGKIDTTIDYGFTSARDFNASMDMTTRIYGMVRFKHGRVKALRHVLTPSVGFSYRPDFGSEAFNYYYYARLDTSSRRYQLSRFEGAVIGPPPAGRQGNVNLGLNNNLQMKVRSSKDTATGYKNITLLDAFSINTSYNLAVDSFQWSPIRIAARANIADRLNFTGSATFDPYSYDYENMRPSPRTMYDLGKGIARFTGASLALSSSFRSGAGKSKAPPVNNAGDDDYSRLMRNNAYMNYVDFNIPWNANLSYMLSLTRTPSAYSKSDTSIITQSVMISGDFNLTARWKVAFNTGYDITNKQMSISSIDIYRDLHCWEMRMGLIPFGRNKSFNFTLNVKAQVLHDLRLLRRRDYRDAVY